MLSEWWWRPALGFGEVASGSAVPTINWEPPSKTARVDSVGCHIFVLVKHAPVTTIPTRVGEASHLCKRRVVTADVQKGHSALKKPLWRSNCEAPVFACEPFVIAHKQVLRYEHQHARKCADIPAVRCVVYINMLLLCIMCCYYVLYAAIAYYMLLLRIMCCYYALYAATAYNVLLLRIIYCLGLQRPHHTRLASPYLHVLFRHSQHHRQTRHC